LFEWTGVDASLGLAALALAALGACAWRRRGSSHSRLERDLIATGAALLLPLLASQIVWDHYFLFALPAICVVLRPGPVSGARALAGGVALLGSAVTPLRILWPSVEPIGIAITLMLSTATLFGLLLWDLAGRKPEGTA